MSAILLTLLGGVSYLSLSTCQQKSVIIPVRKNSHGASPVRIRLAPRPEGGEQDSEIQKLPPLIEEINQGIARSRMKRADLALQDTPEKHQAAIHAMLEHRKPHFDALFNQWDLPPDRRSSAYEVIRLRLDRRRRDSVNRSIAHGLGSPEHKSSRDEIDLQAARNLREILGEERSVELINLAACRT